MPQRLLVSVASVLLSAAPAFAQDQDFSKVEVKTVPVAGSVSMLQGSGGNIAVLVGPEGVLVVDDEFAPLVPKILTAIGRLSSKPVRFVVNTHWHGDHTGGNAILGAEGAVIVAQDNVRKRMSTEQFNAFIKRRSPPSPAIALPIVTFAEGVRFYLDGEDIEVTHIGPGHTDGDSTVWFHKANVIHMGDNFFNGMYPAIDGDAGGSLDGMVTALEGVLGRIDDQTKVIPGHGPLGTKADLKRFHDMLVTIGDRVRQAIHDGKTQDQVLAMKPSADLDAVWGNGFLKPDFFVTLVYVLLKP